MALVNKALTNLPQVDLILPDGNAAASLDAFRGLANLVMQMQAEELVDGSYDGSVAKGNSPYTKSVWDITIADSGTTITAVFDSEVTFQDSGAKGRAALTTRRPVDIVHLTSANDFTMKSFLAVLNFIEKLEDKVAQTGVSATGDGTYTAVSLRGNTPFESYEWTVVKLADLYTLTSTANSN